MGLADRIRPTVPKDIAKELGPAGLACLLQLMIDAYSDLRARNCIQADTSEDTITEEWFVHIQQRWKQNSAISCIPIHQKQDATKAKARGRPPTIDFCFRDCFDPRSYFGAECKLLDAGNSGHLTAYLDDIRGIGRLLDGRYAAHTGAGAMVGYVRCGSCEEVAASLGRHIQTLKGRPRLRRSGSLPDFECLYESKHLRDCSISEFLCYHLLFGFNRGAA